ncbi:MAG: thiol oxidoreductase [Gammaproteobacteria bacterium]|nr:thiol oxidoreductase [Gammaproteobacteria bacterium]
MRRGKAGAGRILTGLALSATALGMTVAVAQVTDPGVRKAAGDGGAPTPLAGLSSQQLQFFQDGLRRFQEIEQVSNGLGPRFNSNQCSSCHSQPVVGGSSPAANPLYSVVNAAGAGNQMPWFIAPNGPVREVRFKQSNGAPDGGVHDLFVISGRTDVASCNLTQPSFLPAGDPVSGRGGNPNLAFRIPTPTFGGGLIEAIPDSVILANVIANTGAKQSLGVFGHPNTNVGGTVNRSANDGTITRFGWKAQNKSLLVFAGEAYNVEMGVSNEVFPQERDEGAGCLSGVSSPNDHINMPDPSQSPSAMAVLSDTEAFAMFMRLLAPPQPAPATPSTTNGSKSFASIGCALCHVPVMNTGATGYPGFANQPVQLYSDLLVHHMGQGLADGVTQGGAGPDEFRTAPLWGLGQRVFFLHDGRTGDLVQAIRAHASFGSEANSVVLNFARLSSKDQQDLINFLRSL